MASELEHYTKWLENKVEGLNDRVTELEECCTRRGARMQTLKDTLDTIMLGRNVSPERWQDIISWFDEDNVPLDTGMVRVSGVPYKVPRESLE